MHAANIANSPRLQRTLAALRSAPAGLTTREVVRAADVCAVNSIVKELRLNGCAIACTQEGRGRFRYTLIMEPTHGGTDAKS